MIVITWLSRIPKHLFPGDHFQLCIKDETGCSVVIDEEISVQKVIDYIASFRFALDDGTCQGFHLTGIFANSAELPTEIQNAVMFADLPEASRQRFAQSCGIDLKDAP